MNDRGRQNIKKAFTIFIGFFHDFAAGCWAATVLAVYWLDRVASQRPELMSSLDGLERQFFWAGVGCTAAVLAAGMGRTFTYAYIGSVYGEQSEQLRRRMLAIKHILLLTVFGLGTWWQYAMAYYRP
jgi:putative copper export protein